MNILKPCPFCGSSFVSVFQSDKDKLSLGVHFDEPVAIVMCLHCASAAGFVKIGGRHTREEAVIGAIEYWNTRAEEEYEEEYEE